MEFNFNKFIKDNPLLKETSGYGNYTRPETMLEDDPQDTYNRSLRPDEELMEAKDKVNEVYSAMMEHMRKLIKKHNLNYDEVYELSVKLAEFFK